ncbi:SRPBCC family protein [Paractinoplanes toevensis]|uniref:Polyketide cyclase n=1 Tax=Paractinoplanes toevensis TaxID=571911 RepID=A0A919W3Z8_9ACTN|nr:SRPBCC family protein [Actinoplanes toevensis]GIM91055.1 polyketide cyclase [Actinoplanes toevensis]
MPTDTAHLAERIDRPAADVYAYVADPAHLPDWAPGLGEKVERDGDEWFVVTPGGRVKVVFAPPNEFGVLDHVATFPNGESFLNPLRVVPYGDGSEIVFSVRRAPGTPDEDFARDTGLVAADLARLKGILEAR